MDQEYSKCPDKSLLLLAKEKATSPGAERNLPPEMSHRESPENKQQAQPRYLCALSFPVCSMLVLPLSQVSISPQFLPCTFSKFFMRFAQHQAFSLFLISPLPSRDPTGMMSSPLYRVVLLSHPFRWTPSPP